MESISIHLKKIIVQEPPKMGGFHITFGDGDGNFITTKACSPEVESLFILGESSQNGPTIQVSEISDSDFAGPSTVCWFLLVKDYILPRWMGQYL
jgi:hypothetical protein